MPAHLKLPNEISTDVEFKTIYGIFFFNIKVDALQRKYFSSENIMTVIECVPD